jgi:hypothetical protein
MTTIILGAQWGDEGKGKLTDILCAQAQICARAAVSWSIRLNALDCPISREIPLRLPSPHPSFSPLHSSRTNLLL